MIDVLVSGRLRGAPQLRRAANGSPFATFRVAAAGKNGESLLCSCVTFSKSSIEAVQSLEDGDSIAVSGEGAIGGRSSGVAVTRVIELKLDGGRTFGVPTNEQGEASLDGFMRALATAKSTYSGTRT